MSSFRLLVSVLIFLTFGAILVNGQKSMTGVISATNPDGTAFGNAIYYTAYDSTRQLIHGVGVGGKLYSFDSNTLVLQNTTNLRQLTFPGVSFANLNIPVGIHIKTGSNSRLIITYSLTSNAANMVHTIMLNAVTLVPVAVLTTDWASSAAASAPTQYDRTTYHQGSNVYLRSTYYMSDEKAYAFDVSSDSFNPFISPSTYSDPYGYSITYFGVRQSESIGKPYFDGKNYLFYDYTVGSGIYRTYQYFVTDFMSYLTAGTPLYPDYGIRRLMNPSPYSANATVFLGNNSPDQLAIKSTVLGSSSSYIVYLSTTSQSKGNFIVQVPSSGYTDVNNNNLAVKSLTVFPSQTTFTHIEVDEDAYPANNTRVFFLATSTGRVFKHRFRDNGGQLDIESTPVTTENIVAGGIPFTDQTLITSEKRIIVSSNADVPNDQSKLYIVPFADCGSKTTCSSCIAMNDPYCGWCVLDGKCSYNSSCSSSNLQNGWLKTPGTNQCPSVSNFVSQSPIPVAKLNTYQFSATTIPVASYTCRFTRENGVTINAAASLSLPTVSCTLPASITGNLFYGTYENLSLSLVNSNVVFATFSNAITIYDCSNMTTCSGCQSLIYSCGWCVLDGKCTTSSSCSYSTTPGGSFQWLASGSNNCPTAVSASPTFIDIIAPETENRKVTVSVDYMPSKIPNLSAMTCNYLRSNGATYSVDISNYNSFVLSGNTLPVECPIPLDYDQQLFNSGDRESVTISLSFSDSGKTIIPDSTATRFYFSSCSTKTTCESCTSQDFPCVWATDINACDSPNGETTLPYSITSAAKCPSIVSSPFIYIAENTAEGIQIQGKNLPEKNDNLLYRNGIYTCVFSNGLNTTGNRASDELLVCPSPLVNVDNGLSSNITVTVQYGNPTIQGNIYTLPQSSSIAVAYFDCNYYGESCLTCREASSMLSNKCGWCKSNTGKAYCSTQSNCTNTNDWSFSDCPAPSITAISPTSGPINGGTLIFISGQNLGLGAQAIDYIQIGTVGFCREITWVNTNTIKCLTDTVQYPDSGKVVVSISGVIYTSPQTFSYVIPALGSIAPNKGPVAGGTSVVISGNYTNVGSNFKINFGGQQCRNLTFTQISESEHQISCLSPPVDRSEQVNITVTIDDAVLAIPFTYTPNPKVESISPRFSHASGKANMTITGSNLDLVENPVVRIGGVVAKILNSKKRSGDTIVVEIPDITESIQPDDPITVSIQIAFGTYVLNSDLNFIVYANPTITEFSPTLMYTDDIQEVFIVGTDLLRGGNPKITVAGVDCVPNNKSKNSLVKCDLDKSNLVPGVGKISMQINAINASSTGDFTLSSPPEKSNKLVGPIVGGLAGLFLLLLLIGVIIYWYKMKRNKKKTQMLFAELDQANEQNMKVLSEVMEAYTEYNTRDKTFSNPLFGAAAISFTSFESYAVETLFPKDESVSPPAIIGFSSKSREFKLITDFKQLLLNENFTSVFLKTMEKQSDFKVIDRKYTAAILMISLHSNMDYATKLLFHLMKEYIQDKVKSGESKTILRATSTITEKYLTAWLAFSLFSFIQEHLSKQLLNTYASIKGQIEKGAVDYLTGSSQYTINASSILRQKVNYERIKIKIGYLDKSPMELEVNTCDCISQVINSALFVFEGNTKNAPNVGLFNSSGKSLQDVDSTNEVDGEWTKYNTLEHYQIKAGDELKLMKKVDEKPTESTAKYYHIEKKVEGATEQKVAPSEVFFTRMMTMREVIHQHVDSLFESVFSAKEAPPVPVKLLFDFLDQSARDLGVNDPDTIHIWKNNSLALRFWVNLITNPNQLFDITKTVPVHNSLSTVGQVLMDSCSTSEMKLGQGAPASKLLYKNEVEEYKKLVTKYYEYVRQAHLPSNPTIPVPPTGGEKLDENSALYELRKYANKYSEQIKEALSGDLKNQFEENMK